MRKLSSQHPFESAKCSGTVSVRRRPPQTSPRSVNRSCFDSQRILLCLTVLDCHYLAVKLHPRRTGSIELLSWRREVQIARESLSQESWFIFWFGCSCTKLQKRLYCLFESCWTFGRTTARFGPNSVRTRSKPPWKILSLQRSWELRFCFRLADQILLSAWPGYSLRPKNRTSDSKLLRSQTQLQLACPSEF